MVSLLVLCCLAGSWRVQAADWPQFRGPHRDDVSAETGLLKQWPAKGPSLLWTYRDAGVGYSGPAIVGDRLFTMGARGDTEFVFALSISQQGKQLWATPIGPKFDWKKGNEWNQGPAATPTVDGDRVYALGGQGILVCVDVGTGKLHWRKDLPAEMHAVVNNIAGSPQGIGWGFTWSPLVDGGHLIIQPGGPDGTLGALDKRTGSVIWRSKGFTDGASYASPIAADVGGQRQYIQLTNSGLTGVWAKDGKTAWHYAEEYHGVVIPTPLVHDNKVYASASGGGCVLVSLTSAGGKVKAKKIYANNNLTNQSGGVLLVDRHVFGSAGIKGWLCQDFATGKITGRERRRLGAGSLTCADGRLYCYGEEEGTIVLVDANPTKWTMRDWKEYGRFTIPEHSKLRKVSGKIWTHPVVANGKLYLRDQDLIFCYDVKAQATSGANPLREGTRGGAGSR
ncbi:MAG TPA: PQQ-binding-like beta-propeller repeat protein [Gemmataceae bacterium]|nr:PQQ-binding-like beta-propeller repeat protein [Gemmataceae bacterium]